MPESNIYKQLRDAQLELKAPKNQTGRFGKSRSAEAILEAAKPVLAKHGLTLLVSDEMTHIEGRHYVKATASVYNDAGEHVSSTAHAWEGELDRGLDSSQVTGKTSSYARKYALGGLLAIDDTKDADTHADESAQQQRPTQAKPAVGSAAPAAVDPGDQYINRVQTTLLLRKAQSVSGLADKADVLAFFEEEAGVPVNQVKVKDLARIKAIFGDGVEVEG